MNDFMKGWGSAGLDALACIVLGAASFFAVEALMLQPADAATVHLQCQMVGTGSDGGPHQREFTFNEDEQKATMSYVGGSTQRFDNAVIGSSLISMTYQVSGFPFTVQVDRVTGKVVHTFNGELMATGTCTKAKPTQRAF